MEEVKQTKHKTHRWLIALAFVGLVFLSAGIVFLILALQTDFHTQSFIKTRDVAYKSEYQPTPGDVCFGNFFYCDRVDFKADGDVNVEELGDYKVTFTFAHDDKTLSLEQNVSVKDLVPPVITIDDDNIAICAEDKVSKFKFSSIDDYDGDITDKATISYKAPNVEIVSTDQAGNQSTKTAPAATKDTTPPTITLNGSDKYTSPYGTPYNDAGAIATDNCDNEIEVKVDGTVNPFAIGNYTITYTATDQAGNTTTATRTVTVSTKIPQPTGNVIYLTFDDGPSEHTFRLLDVLKKHDVKATFFVIGHGSDEAIRRAYQEGHSIGLHTSSHTYSKIYQSESAFYADLDLIKDRVKRITGYTSTLLRFPGGSSNTVSRSYNRGIMSRLVRSAVQKGYTYFDWNVSSGDAGGAKTADQVYNNVVSTLKKGNSIVLQHDTQGYSVDAVERIIEYGKANGYTFARLEPGFWGAHHGVNN